MSTPTKSTDKQQPPPLPPRPKPSAVPPPLPPRTCIESGEPILKSYSSSRPVGHPPLLPPRSKVTPIVIPGPIEKSSGNIELQGGLLYEFKRWIKEISKSEEYTVVDDFTITGSKTSLIFFISLFISIIMTVVPIVTGDTELYECEEQDSGEDVCVLSGKNNPIVYFFLAFYQYPWVLAAYFKTGLWMNASGINVKINALYGNFDVATEFKDWERKDFLALFDMLYLFVSLVAYVIFYTQTQCTCGDSINLLMGFFMCSAILAFPMYIGYAAQLQFSSYDPEHRMKVLKRFFFWFETGTSGVIYIGTYGYAGVLFMVIPILGYIESFGFFSW